MNLYEKDAIVALATPRGIGALSVIRVSGDGLSMLFSKLAGIKKIKPRYAYYKGIGSSSGEKIDNVLMTFFKGPFSFTGEDVFEISCHGGEIISKKVIQELISLGCRHAEPGEFSKRAFLNGKIDLLQAESINNIIHSKSALEAQKGLMTLEGKSQAYLIKIKESLVTLLTIIEHELDFVETEVTHLSEEVIKNQLQDVLILMEKIIHASLAGNKVQSGFKVALIGPPNAGKSSLFNSLLGYDRAIISSEKGTTRDTIEAFVEIEGLPVVLIDTAGHWESKNSLDALGVKETNKTIKKSDILVSIDEKNPAKFIKPFNIKNKPVVYVSSKLDLKKNKGGDKKTIHLSSLEDKNINVLLTELSTIIRASFFQEDVFLCSERQLLLLKSSQKNLLSILKNFASVEPVKRASIVRDSLENMQEIFGEVYNEEILNNIFKGFCVGK